MLCSKTLKTFVVGTILAKENKRLMTRTILTALLVALALGVGVGGGTAIGRNFAVNGTGPPPVQPALPDIKFPVSFQGVLSGAGNASVSDGDHNVVFSIYASADGATPLWQESQTITTTDGKFNALTSRVATLDSRPTMTSPAGWTGSAGETEGDVGDWSLTVYAICANVTF